ncbi:MAG: DUF2188 domain-containing protein [Acidobacteriota bacterium]
MATKAQSFTVPKVTQHVAPSMEGGWNVRRGRARKATRHFETREEAISFGRELSKRQGAALYIHREDGLVQSKESYEKASRRRSSRSDD